jgi:uncharacterized repeat protein (TIGR03806 family)
MSHFSRRALRPALLLSTLLLGLAAGPIRTHAQGGDNAPFGLTNRVRNTTLQFPLTAPVPTNRYSTTNAFGTMTFTAPVALVSAPGESNRIFIVEQMGRIVVITNLANPTRTVFMDISGRVTFNGEQGLLGLAFHPGYLTNRLFFVFYVTTGTRRDRLSRFEISAGNANQGDTNSEVILFSQADDFNNHNAGDLHFGSDGYLYVTLGDEGDANDTGANSQKIDKDFFSGMMRLDVDKRPGSLLPNPHVSIAAPTNYAVPPDNPFIGATTFNGLPITGNVRTEFWAVGLRNPWRFCIDEPTGRIFVGDVGQGAREEVDVIVRGGNYGWNYREGYIQRPGSGTPPAGFSSIPPILDYPRNPAGATNVGFSVTGGVVYRGSRIPALAGAYVFGDYGSGNIWAARYDGSVTTNVPFVQLLADPGVSAFGLDPSNGDVLYADVGDGTVRRLLYTNLVGAPLPGTLAQSGVFSNLTTLTPHAGILPYDINLPSWSDGALKSRWFYIPTNGTITFRDTNNWTFPTGSVFVQHFELELTNGAPASRKRIETRVLMRDASSGAYGVTYRWGDSSTNATLVDTTGFDESFVINDGGTLRTQAWHYPARSECLQCHTFAGGLAPGFNTPQLNRDFLYPNGVTDNQLRSLNNARYFSATVSNLHRLRFLAPLDNEDVSVEQRVRSYLSVNCVHCHQPSAQAPNSASFDGRLFTPLSQARLVNYPVVNSGGNTNARVIVPGSIPDSLLLSRIAVRGGSQMPPLDTSIVDTQAIALVRRWITNDLASYQSLADWQQTFFGSTNAPEAAAGADPDVDNAPNSLEWLTGTDPTNTLDFWAIAVQRAGDSIQIAYPRRANRGFEVQWKSDASSTSAWQFLNVPVNRPFLSSTNGTTRVPDGVTNGPVRFYRARVFEP